MDVCAVTAGLAFISNGGGRLCCSLSSPLIPASSAYMDPQSHFLVFTLSEAGPGSGVVASLASTVLENSSHETLASWPLRIEDSFLFLNLWPYFFFVPQNDEWHFFLVAGNRKLASE